jgi:uncharacterized protein DUF6319
MSNPEQPAATDAKGAARKARTAAAEPADITTVEEAAPTAPTPDTAVDASTAAADSPADSPAEPAEATGADAPAADGEPEKRRRGRPKGSTTARTTRTIELMLTVSGTADGEWQAELKQGSSWLSRGLPVSATAVARAARELHPELADPIDTAIGAAREQRAARVAALEAELEQARKALAEMDG